MMKNFIFVFSFAFAFVFSSLVSFDALSQQNDLIEKQQSYQQDFQQVKQQEEQQFSEAELAQMLAPIALYPDSLLTHILISSTYPIEIIEAHRWLKKNDKLNADQISKAIKRFDWDASVKALVPFEQILSRLSDDLSWMQQLGDAFLQDETRVLESIQALREQAKLAGNLGKMENMDVSYEDNNIIIEPLEKEIVYVPYYDTRMVYGAWYWSSYPPVYWTPSHRVYVNHYNPFYWHSGINVSFNYFFSTFNWPNRHVVVVNPHKSQHRYYHQRSRRLIASSGYAKRWSHQPVHRKGVAYKNKYTREKYYSSSGKTHKTSQSSQYSQQQFKQHLSVNDHTSSKKEAKRSSIRPNSNERLRSTTKSYSTNIQHKDIGKNERHSPAVEKSNNHTSKKQHHQRASSKAHRSNNTKARH